jgi:hypothetical protein
VSAPRFDNYDWPGGREAMLRFGPAHGPTVLAALPLFEEANRTRASLIAVLRRLADREIASALPDLPGTGESLVSTVEATLADWRTAFAAAARALPGPVHVVAWRGGALVDAEAEVASRWWLAPVSGAETMRELRRIRAASGGDLYAGNVLSDAMVAELEIAQLETAEHRRGEPHPGERRGPGASSPMPDPDVRRGGTMLRTVRLATDPRPADAHRPGRPLWRAAEPGTDPALEAALADDIAAWITRCEG